MIRDAVINFLTEHSVIPSAPSDSSCGESAVFVCQNPSELALMTAIITDSALCGDITVTSDENRRLYLGFGRCRNTRSDVCLFKSRFDFPVTVEKHTPRLLITADPDSLSIRAERYSDKDVSGNPGPADSNVPESRTEELFSREKLEALHRITGESRDDGENGLLQEFRKSISLDDTLMNANLSLCPCHDDYRNTVELLRKDINGKESPLLKAVAARKAVFTVRNTETKTFGSLRKMLSGLIMTRLTAQSDECFFYASLSADGTDENRAGREKGTLFVSFTPEKLFLRNGRTLCCDALAGSVPPEKAETLISDCKNLSENRIVADYVSDRLSEICDPVKRSAPGLKKLSYITHLLVKITGELKDDTSVEDIVKKLHPTPATLGYPADEAIKSLRACHGLISGDYAGIGGLRYHDTATALVLLRSAAIRPDSVTLYGGAGIMGESDPENEWQETGLKMTAVLRRIAAPSTVKEVLSRINGG